MIKRDELKSEYQQHQFYEYFNSIFNYDILDTSISENIYYILTEGRMIAMKNSKDILNNAIEEVSEKRTYGSSWW